MTGMFELFIDAQSRFRFRLVAPDGTVMAVSKSFSDKPAAVTGIRNVREYAGMGLITDLCPSTDRAAPRPDTGRPSRYLAAGLVARQPKPVHTTFVFRNRVSRRPVGIM